MKKIIGALLFVLSTLLLTGCGDNEEKQAEKQFGVCTTEQDAMDMMIASQVHSYKLQKDTFSAKKIYEDAYDANKQRKLKSSEEDQKVEVLRQKMNQASSLWVQYTENTSSINRDINAKKYQKACDRYIKIAEKYDFDIESASKTTVTMGELGNGGAKKGGECGVSETSVAFMFFLEDAKKQGKFDSPEVKGLMESAGLDQIQNPNRLCKKLKAVSDKLGFSYTALMQRTKLHLEKGKKLNEERVALIKSNENNNKKCSANDAIELNFKQDDFEKKFFSLYDKWTNRIRSISDAKLYDSARKSQAEKKRKEVDKARAHFYDEFKETVQKHAADTGKYDLACENYEKLVNKNKLVIKKLKQIYIEFHNNKKQQVAVDSASEANNQATANGNVDGPIGGYSSGEKYNVLVDLVNQFSPKIRSSFETYAKSCGTDKKTRQKTMFTTIAGEKIKLPNTYTVTKYYDGYYKDHALKQLNEALASKSLLGANNAIKAYKDSIETFMQLFTKTAEYYKMKDYAEDGFKKGDEMHAPLIAAYDEFLIADQKIRQIIDEISNARTLKKIDAYKANNDMLFYYVEKAQYLAENYYKYAGHKEDLMTVDSAELLNKLQLLRDHYDEFKRFKNKNEQIFKDNGDYTYYLGKVSDYLATGKDLYLRVKNKKRYDEGEEDFLQHVPEQARAIILSNKKGSLSMLLKAYNVLVDNYNKLNM